MVLPFGLVPLAFEFNQLRAIGVCLLRFAGLVVDGCPMGVGVGVLVVQADCLREVGDCAGPLLRGGVAQPRM